MNDLERLAIIQGTDLERITVILAKARVAGGWIDEDVAKLIVDELGLDQAGGSESTGS